MLLTQRQIDTLKVFAGGKLISAQALCKDMAVAKGIAQNRIAELHDKGLIRKVNQTQYQISKKGEDALASHVPLTARKEVKADEDDDKPLSDKEMDRLLDAAVEEAVEHPEQPTGAPMTMEQFAELPADELEVKILKIPEHIERVERSAPVPSTHPAIDAIHELQERLSKPVAIEIDDLYTKKLVLIQLARILDPSISDVLVSICDDLDRATGNPL